jgi:hypothetical protein
LRLKDANEGPLGMKQHDTATAWAWGYVIDEKPGVLETLSETCPVPLPPRLTVVQLPQGPLRGGAEHRPDPNLGHRRTAAGALSD